MPVIIGALGSVIGRLQRELEKLDYRIGLEIIQKACLLGSARIVRKVLDTPGKTANRRQVYKNIHHEFPAIITCLEEQILDGVKNRSGTEPANSRVRGKADKARELKGKKLNTCFLLTLSGLADAYGQFGLIVKVAQMVQLLLHERLELFMEAVDFLLKMEECLDDHSKCNSLAPESRKQRCLLPLNQEDKKGLKIKNEIRGLPIVSQCGIQAAGLQNETQSQSLTMRMKSDSKAASNKQILCWLREIHSGLKSDVYDQASNDMVHNTK
eukprot:gene10636-19378_t